MTQSGGDGPVRLSLVGTYFLWDTGTHNVSDQTVKGFSPHDGAAANHGSGPPDIVAQPFT